LREAEGSEATAVVFTFDPHPRAVLQAPRSPRILTPLPEKLAVLEALGIDLTVVLRFDHAFASTPADVFVEKWLLERFRPLRVVVGYDFRLGRGREGNAAMLAEYGSSHGFAVDVVSPFVVDGRPVKSPDQDEIESGNVSRAAVIPPFHSLSDGSCRGFARSGDRFPDGERRLDGGGSFGRRRLRRLQWSRGRIPAQGPRHASDVRRGRGASRSPLRHRRPGGRPLPSAVSRSAWAGVDDRRADQQIGRDCRKAAEILSRADERFFFTRL
jgi:hypothetical protein